MVYWVQQTPGTAHLQLCNGHQAPPGVQSHVTAKDAWRATVDLWSERLAKYQQEAARVAQILRFAELGLFSSCQHELPL